MEIIKSSSLLKNQFYPTQHKKTQLFWHHTAGLSATSAINWWNQTPEHVGVAYVIDRDGKIYETFDPRSWGYHLGISGDDDFVEKSSIGIELVSTGPVQKEGENYIFYPLWPSKLSPKKIDANSVVDMGEEGWRGFRYFQGYTEKQIKSLIDLTNQLIVDFKIEVQKDFKNSEFFDFNEAIYKQHLPGIWSHTSVRKDKNDIIPYKAFLDTVFEGIKTTQNPIPVTSNNKKK